MQFFSGKMIFLKKFTQFAMAKKLERFSIMLLRFGLGGVFVFHGTLKLFRVPFLCEILELPLVFIYLLACAEILSGVFMIFGGYLKRPDFTRVSALIMIVILTISVLKMQWGQWVFAPTQFHPLGGMEFSVVLLILAIFFLIKGNSRC